MPEAQHALRPEAKKASGPKGQKTRRPSCHLTITSLGHNFPPCASASREVILAKRPGALVASWPTGPKARRHQGHNGKAASQDSKEGQMDETRDRRTRIIAVGNQKGGVGKTTNTVQLARALAERGRKCLIFDLDMNHGATNHFGIDANVYAGSYEVLLGSETPDTVVLTRDLEEEVELPENVDLIPASRKLENISAALAERNKMLDPHRILADPLKSLRGVYDYVFLDTAPNATPPTIAAYKSAEWFLLSAMPETFAIQGLDAAIQDIDAARKHGNPHLRLLGVILCRVDKRTRLSKQLVDYVQREFVNKQGDNRTFRTQISHSTVISAAQKLGKTIFEAYPEHKVTQEYREFAKEFEERLEEYDRKDAEKAAGNAQGAEKEVMTPEVANA